MPDTRRRAWRARRADFWVSFVLGLAMTAIAVETFARLLRPSAHTGLALTLPVMAFLAWQFIFSSAAARGEVKINATEDVTRLSVVALVPVYNEDPHALRQCLESLLAQSRPLQAICVIDDGSSDPKALEATRWWLEAAGTATGVRTHWERQDNAGKRAAQWRGITIEPRADVYLTVDSDSVLDPLATEKSMTCFADPTIQSVAAIIVSTNYGTNLLTRIMDLYTVSLQLFERSALSSFGSVLVNCGGCAYYRGGILRENARTYLRETLFGQPMRMSDDSMLTLFALEQGRAVQHPEAFAFTLMPENFSHTRRQQLRWMRGSLIRSGWRFSRLPLGRPAYWLHLARWIQFALVMAGIVVVATSGVLANPMTWLSLGISSIGIYMLVAARYLSVRRSDQSARQRWAVFATAPLTALWSATVLRALRWYAYLTFAKIGRWGTRSTVEVLAPAH